MKTLLSSILGLAAGAAFALEIAAPRCESAREPLGVPAAAPRFTWALTGAEPAVRPARAEVRVCAGAETVWQGAGDDLFACVYGGPALTPGRVYTWQVRLAGATDWCAPQRFSIGLQQEADWEGAQWIGDEPCAAANPKEVKPGKGKLPQGTLQLRRAFTLQAKPLAQALVSVCGFGFYELWLNGAKVDPRRVLAPGMTAGRASLFDTYDVTRQLTSGAANTLGLWLAPGYADDFSQWGWHWLKSRRAILHLAVTYADGTRDVIVTDGTWSRREAATVPRASIYCGETIDATRADAAWCTAAGATNGWRAVHVLPRNDAPPLVANDAPPVRRNDPRAPVRITEPRPGVFVADFGQNRAGVVEVRARGPRGAKIRVHTSELLGKDGLIDPWTNRLADSRDDFILAGTGAVETFLPRFTYHGFRYAEITGWPAGGKPTPADLTGWAVHADVERIGAFESDNETLAKFVNAATWSMLSNFVSYPTDCAMRDERTPCQMDSQAYEDAALTWFNLARYYGKWADDIAGSRGNPDWTGDAATLPLRLYRETGDTRILARYYDQLKAQVDADVKAHPDLVWKDGFGDWCAPNDGTWKDYFNDVSLVNTAILCDMARCVAEAAEALGRADDAAAYRALRARMLSAFQKAFFHADAHTYGDGSQTTAVLPLAFGLVPEAERAPVAAQLVETIRGRDKSRVDVGIFGMRYLGDVLCDWGAGDLFLTLMTQPEYPGFGYMFANGATTLWEQWTFRGGMNSHNHAMFSGALHALTTRFAGIRAAKPGYAAVEIRPSFPKGLGRVTAHRDTPRGRVSVAWRREGGRIVLELERPPYVPTTLVVPGQEPRRVPAGRSVFEVKN